MLVDYQWKEEAEDGVFPPFGVAKIFASHLGGIGEQLGSAFVWQAVTCANSGSPSHSSKWLAAERSRCLTLSPGLGRGWGSETCAAPEQLHPLSWWKALTSVSTSTATILVVFPFHSSKGVQLPSYIFLLSRLHQQLVEGWIFVWLFFKQFFRFPICPSDL